MKISIGISTMLSLAYGLACSDGNRESTNTGPDASNILIDAGKSNPNSSNSKDSSLGSSSSNDAGESSPNSSNGKDSSLDSSSTKDGQQSIATSSTCEKGESAGEVQQPVFWKNLRGQTSWFASPIVQDLDGDGNKELVAAYYSIYVFNSQGELLDEADEADSRVYAPHVVADLDNDGITEVIAANGKNVWAWEWRNEKLQVKAGWPFDTTSAGESPEVRGLAASDLDWDGYIEVIATTTQTQKSLDGGAQVFVLNSEGDLYQPQSGHNPAWPRYNALNGSGNDADRNLMGHNGFGCYGLNVGIGNIDDDAELEILVTYDNHHIQAFNHDGVAIDASEWFTNRANEYTGQRLTWGQFIRWADPQVEADHYHAHTGQWPHPSWTEWLQWTASPPSIADLDMDGKNEIIGVPNIEMHEPYETQAYGVMVLEGAYGDTSRSAMRKQGWETLPRGQRPIQVQGWYPPKGIPAATITNIQGDDKLEIVTSLNDGSVYLFDSEGSQIFQYDYTHSLPIMFASEISVADLNQDGTPELLFSTFGDPDAENSGYLMILAADGTLLYDIPLPNPGHNGNGNGAPAAPAVYDLDGDGQLEIFVQTFDHGMDVFTVPGSSENCLLWPTARGGPMRTGNTH